MNRTKLVALMLALILAPVTARSQQPDTIKKADSAKAKVDTTRRDTATKESTAEKIGRQTGASLDKAAKTTEHNAKELSKRTADNTKQGYKDTKSDVSRIAKKAAQATKTNAKHLKEDFKKATADTIKLPPKPDSTTARPDSSAPASPTRVPY